MILHNLLCDPLISVRPALGGAAVGRSLPEVLADLVGDRVGAFTRLAAHQRQGWYCLLVQIAALALHRADLTEPPAEAEGWRRALRALTPDHLDDAPWSLVVADITRPAFLQPPVRRGSLDAFKNAGDTPDGLDILITAKNHDVKMARVGRPAPEHWLYALVNLQTLQGFLGRGNYGVARMNGGFASRPFVGRAPGPGWGERFRRDLAVLLDGRDKLLGDFPDYFQKRGGLALLWLEPWDDDRSLSLSDLDPWFVEICRRVRLGEAGGRIVAHTRPSDGPRVAAQAAAGYLGDPWIPVKKEKEKEAATALTVSASGFDYRLTAQLLGGAAITPSAALEPHPGDGRGDVLFVASVLVRGQGRTDGLHDRQIPIPARAARLLAFAEGRESVGTLAKRRVDQADAVRRVVLRFALLVLIQGGPDGERLKSKDNRPQRWLDHFDQRVDAIFFDRLWPALDDDGQTGEDPDKAWRRELKRIAEAILEQAAGALPIPVARRPRAIAQAERAFNGAFFNLYPDLREAA